MTVTAFTGVDELRRKLAPAKTHYVESVVFGIFIGLLVAIAFVWR